MSRRFFWLRCSLLVTLASSAAYATENFPTAIATALAIKPPPCNLCHEMSTGSKGTVTKPFGRKLQAYGLEADDVPTLNAILGQMRDARDDSDHDGVSDIDELEAGTDPNINDITGEPPEDYAPPVYGCHASRAPANGRGWALAAAAFFIAGWFRRRDRKHLCATMAALALGAAGIAACHNAPLDVVDGVDLARFQGRWYEIARLPRATQIDCAGTTASYRMTSDRELVVTNECAVGGLTGIRRQVVASAKVTNAATPAKLSVDFGGFYGDYWIIDLDRDDYGYAVVGHPTRQYLWILSRTPTLEAATLAPIIERANQKGFDTSRLEYTKQLP